jgi:hypothetical protein
MHNPSSHEPGWTQNHKGFLAFASQLQSHTLAPTYAEALPNPVYLHPPPRLRKCLAETPHLTSIKSQWTLQARASMPVQGTG